MTEAATGDVAGDSRLQLPLGREDGLAQAPSVGGGKELAAPLLGDAADRLPLLGRQPKADDVADQPDSGGVQRSGLLAPVDAARPAGSPAGPRTERALPAGLSAREAEVLRLVTAGLTNAEVADQLFLRPRTVDAHLRRIYPKLVVTARRRDPIRGRPRAGLRSPTGR